MKRLHLWVVLLLYSSSPGCAAQQPFGTDQLHLKKAIALPGVKGRIDHLDINLKDHVVYVAALGNNTVEAVDLVNGKVIYSIPGLDEPQGVGYIPQKHELFIANGGNGDCYFYNAQTFAKVATIHLASDADDVRYDSASRKIYVGYGRGGVAIIDADSHQQIGDVKLPAHPESFQLDKQMNLLYVNLPDAHMVGVVDLKQSLLTGKWEKRSPSANFPMSLDTTHHRVFVGYRHPARLVIYDGRTGKELSSGDMTGDADDLYYDEASEKVYVSGGAGAVSIFQPDKNGGYKQIADIPTRSGARTSLLVPQLKTLIVAARAAAGEPADLLVYSLTP